MIIIMIIIIIINTLNYYYYYYYYYYPHLPETYRDTKSIGLSTHCHQEVII